MPKLELLPTKLDVFQRWCPRRILRIPFSAHVMNSAIYQRADQIPVSKMVLSRRLQLFGHVTCCDTELDHARAMKAMIGPLRTWKRPVGHPRQTWLRGVMTALLPLNLSPSTALRRAQNRHRWWQDIETGTLRHGAHL